MKQDVKCNKGRERIGALDSNNKLCMAFSSTCNDTGLRCRQENYAMAFSPPSSKGSGEIFRRFPIDTLAADVFLS